MYSAGVAMLVVSFATPLVAGGATAVPEIGADSMVTGLAVLAGGILVVRARWRAR
jgi:hypothetical protein